VIGEGAAELETAEGGNDMSRRPENWSSSMRLSRAAVEGEFAAEESSE